MREWGWSQQPWADPRQPARPYGERPAHRLPGVLVARRRCWRTPALFLLLAFAPRTRCEASFPADLGLDAAGASSGAADAPPAADSPGRCAAGAPEGGDSAEGGAPRGTRHIIHIGAAVAALADGGLAQIPGAGSTVVPMIQAAMIYSIALSYGCHLSRSHAIIITTYLLGEHTKSMVVREVLGWIPFAGNIVKTSISLAMTTGIGYIADEMLRCPVGEEELLRAAQAARKTDVEGEEEDVSAMGVFQVVSQYLVSLDATMPRAEDIWQQVVELFALEDQEQLMLRVKRAERTDDLVELVARYSWNLQLVEAALLALQERFEPPEACGAIEFVAERFWISASADAEARSVAIMYMHLCIHHAQPATRRGAAKASADLLVATRGGSRGSLPERVVRASTELIKLFPEDTQPGTFPATLFVSGGGLPELLSALLAALSNGHAPACQAMRDLFSAERAALAHVELENLTTSLAMSWAATRHLKVLDRLSPPVGSELCMPSLRAELAQRLTLATWPVHVERPCLGSTSVGCVDGGRSRVEVGTHHATELDDLLAADIVGQRCAIERLVHSPGHAKLKYRGFWNRDKPLVLLLTGPSGTGKTLLARTLATSFFGQPISKLEASGRFRTFHMNLFSLVEDQKNFFGPPRGTVGAPGDLVELLREWPDAVVLLDEIEKAHPSFARALLKVFGENGAVYDPRTGQEVSTAKATFVLTSNLGKDLIDRHPAARKSDPDCSEYATLHEDLKAALREPRIGGRDNFFKESEIRSRLADTLPFLPFRPLEVEAAVRRYLVQEAKSFQKSAEFQEVSLGWEPEVVSVLAAGYAHYHDEGLRAVHENLQTRVHEAMMSALDTGLLEKGGGVVLRLDSQDHDSQGRGRLDVRVVSPAPRSALSWLTAPFVASTQSTFRDTSSSAPASDAIPVAAQVAVPPAGADEPVISLAEPRGNVAEDLPSGGDPGMWSVNWDLQWETSHEWDWQLAWEKLWDFLWEWRFSIAIFTAMAVIGTSATLASATAARAVGPVSVASAGPVVGSPYVAAGTVSWLSGVLALLQATANIGTLAVPAGTAAFAWSHRQELAALVWGIVALLATANCWRLQFLWRCCQRPARRHGSQKFVKHSSRPLTHGRRRDAGGLTAAWRYTPSSRAPDGADEQ